METQEALAMTADAVDTVPKMFARAVTERGAQVSLRQKHFGIWHSITWTEFGQIAREIGMGLVALGWVYIRRSEANERDFADLVGSVAPEDPR